jgi:hypothetical protein
LHGAPKFGFVGIHSYHAAAMHKGVFKPLVRNRCPSITFAAIKGWELPYLPNVRPAVFRRATQQIGTLILHAAS